MTANIKFRLGYEGSSKYRNQAFVVYSDDQHRWVIPAKQWMAGTKATTYTDWCDSTDAVTDERIVAVVCYRAGLRGACAAGSARWVYAAA